MVGQTQGLTSISSQPPQSNGKSPASSNGNSNTNHSGSPSPSPQGSPSKSKKTNSNRKKWWSRFRWHALHQARAFGGSLIITSMGFPIFASAVTVGLFLAPHFTLPVLYLEHLDPNWYAPVYGFLISVLALLLFAAFRIQFAKARGANMNVYELLKNRHSELKARLGNIDISHHMNNGGPSYQEQYKTNMNTIQPLFTLETENESRYGKEALRKIYEAYYDLDQCLFHNHSGIEWVFGTGYTNAWRIVHRAQEALIEVETTQEVISNSIHDVRSIQSSSISDSTALVHKMLQAVKDLSPEALVYFEELKSDKNYADLFDPPATKNNASPWNPLLNFFKKKQCAPPARSQEMAREAIRQVTHTLNLYQDTLREALVRIRNRVLISVALTGFFTYFLLNTLILWNTPSPSISTATAYYMVGAIAGLFVRFYNESNNKEAPEDYGLFLSRLIATPLLSGLAGVGGVLVTATVSTLGTSGSTLSLNTIFAYPPNLDYLIAAAIFGYAPNLIIGTLQQRAQKYSTDLQNSKGEGTSKDE